MERKDKRNKKLLKFSLDNPRLSYAKLGKLQKPPMSRQAVWAICQRELRGM